MTDGVAAGHTKLLPNALHKRLMIEKTSDPVPTPYPKVVATSNEEYNACLGTNE